MAETEGYINKRAGWFARMLDRVDTKPEQGRAILVGIFVALTTLLLNLTPDPAVKNIRYEEGRTWQEPDLTAPFDFPVLKPENQYQDERQRALSNTPEVFMLAPNREVLEATQVAAQYKRLTEIGNQWRQMRQAAPDSAERKLALWLQALNPNLIPADALYLLQHPEQLPVLARMGDEIARRTYAKAFIDRELASLKGDFISLRRSPAQEKIVEKRAVHDAAKANELIVRTAAQLPPPLARLHTTLLQAALRPNYLFNKDLYEQDLSAAMGSVSRYYGKVTTGQLIVQRGQRVTPEIANVIQSLNAERKRRSGDSQPLLVLLGQLVMVGLVTALTINFLRINRREVYQQNRKTALLFFVFLLVTMLNVLVININTQLTSANSLNYFFLVPMSMGAIIITVFFDDRIGFFSNIIIAVLSGFIIHNNFELFFIQLCAGSVAVTNLSILRKRSQFFTTAGSLLLTYWAAYLGYNLYLKGSFAEINYSNMGLFVMNVLITLATYPLIYVFEKMFVITSDLTYIELLDTGHPLLKELSMKAPGTYQHSLQVANIAEAVATKIGANALQVRVGALFHDIGKTFQPEYFIENQRNGHNPHEQLTPQLSAEIIINHVTYGEDLARLHNLPAEIIDFIRTHHGTSRVEYFYRSHVRSHPEVETDEREFRYKGPLPTSKEMAILMIADGAEAASRSIQNPSPEELRKMVEGIVSVKINDGQLMQARITFKDLFTIKAEILKILLEIYHTRVVSEPELMAMPQS